MSPIALVIRTGSPVDRASFRYLAIALGSSRIYGSIESAGTGCSFFSLRTHPSPLVPIERTFTFAGEHGLIPHLDKAHFDQCPSIIWTDGHNSIRLLLISRTL